MPAALPRRSVLLSLFYTLRLVLKMPLQSFTTPPVPFTISIPQSSISDLHARLSSSHARWPPADVVPDDQSAEEKAAAFGMGWGPTLGMMKQWAEEWAEYDWREKERELNE